ncbi:MAG: extracellular solute-binding protein [Pseudomonadota bacterium]
MPISRRRFMGAGLASVAALSNSRTTADAQPLSVQSTPASEKWVGKLAGAHEFAAAQAKRIAGGSSPVLTLLLPNGSQANIEPLAAWFRERTNINVELSVVPVDEINTHMMIDALSETGSFDVALPATFGLPDLVESNVLLPLDELADTFAPSSYLDDSLYSIGDFYRGRLYGYQTDGDAYVMFYNADWLNDPDEQKRFADQHGVALTLPRTWPELDRVMAYFHRPEAGQFGGALYRNPNYIGWEFWMRFHAKGLWPLDEEMGPQIDREAGTEALAELIAASRYLHPGTHAMGLFENWRRFAEGNTFCNIGWGGTQKFLNGPHSKVRGRLAFGTTPGGHVGNHYLPISYFNWGWNYTVARASKHPDLAYLFILAACSPAMSTVSIRQQDGFFDPFRREHYRDQAIIDVYSQPFLDVHLASMQASIPDLYLKGQGEYVDALTGNVYEASRGDITAEKALARTAQQWRRTTRRMGRAGSVEQWKFLRSRYPQPVRALLS